jgi:hypothetical protein
METLIEIIKELRAENAELKVELKKQSDSSLYWFGRYSELPTKNTEENGSN